MFCKILERKFNISESDAMKEPPEDVRRLYEKIRNHSDMNTSKMVEMICKKVESKREFLSYVLYFMLSTKRIKDRELKARNGGRHSQDPWSMPE